MEQPKSDKETIKAITRGDEKAFEELFKAWYAQLSVFAYKYLGDRQEAENIVQMVFVKFWEKRKELKIQSLKSYLMVSVRNGCINELKRHKHYLSVDEQFNIEMPEEEESFDEVLLHQVKETIDRMPPQRQRIFKMGRFEGMKYREIAAKLGISHKTVEVQMGKALKTLREVFNPGSVQGKKDKVK